MEDISVEVEVWTAGFEELCARIAGRFGRVEPRRHARDYIRCLLVLVERKTFWQIAEYAGHRTPYRFQRLLALAEWEPDRVRDDVREYVFEQLGEPDGVLIVDDTGPVVFLVLTCDVAGSDTSERWPGGVFASPTSAGRGSGTRAVC